MEGNSHGNLVHHLRACGAFAQQIVSQSYPESDHNLISHSLETYLYTALLTRLQLPAPDEECGQSNSSHDLATLLDHARQFRTFGSLLGPAQELYGLMPQVAQYIWCQTLNQSGCQYHADPDVYQSLRIKIESWRSDKPNPTASSKCSMAEHANGVMVQNSLLMLLRYSHLAQRVGLDSAMEAQIQPLIDDNMILIDLIADGPMSNVSLWPLFVTGSMMRKNDERLALVRRMKTHPTQAPVTSRAVQALNWLWNDTGVDDYGLGGVYRVAKKRGAHLCFM
jgi:hypothetical protein